MSRLTNKDDRGRYYTVEEKILIANEPVNPTTTWITNNENRRFGSPIDKLGKLEDLEEEIGCPFEVFGKLRKAKCIYRDDGMAFGFIGIDFTDEDKLILYNDDEWNTFTSDLRLADYKKTWWLKEDKSE